jgi:hypothetical protein
MKNVKFKMHKYRALLIVDFSFRFIEAVGLLASESSFSRTLPAFAVGVHTTVARVVVGYSGGGRVGFAPTSPERQQPAALLTTSIDLSKIRRGF